MNVEIKSSQLFFISRLHLSTQFFIFSNIKATVSFIKVRFLKRLSYTKWYFFVSPQGEIYTVLHWDEAYGVCVTQKGFAQG